MADPTPDRCPSADGQSCKHGHAFTVGCVLPSERNVPSCCRDDLVFDERRQAVTIVRVDAAQRFADWKARTSGLERVESTPPNAPPNAPANGVRAIHHPGTSCRKQNPAGMCGCPVDECARGVGGTSK